MSNVFDLMELEDEDRNQLLSGLKANQVQRVAEAVNRYPNIEVSFKIEDGDGDGDEANTGRFDTNDIVSVLVKLEREEEVEEDEDGQQQQQQQVVAPFYPKPKDEAWWVVLGDPAEKTLLAIKRVTLVQKSQLKLEFKPPRAGNLSLKLYAMCDSYVGCDQEYDLPITIEQGEEFMDEDEEEEEDADDEEQQDQDQDQEMEQ